MSSGDIIIYSSKKKPVYIIIMMRPQVLAVIFIALVVMGAVYFYYFTGDDKEGGEKKKGLFAGLFGSKKEEEEEEEEEEEVEEEEEEEEEAPAPPPSPPPIDHHPLSGPAFIVFKDGKVLYPVNPESGSKFLVKSDGTRSKEMIVNVLPVTGSPGTYNLYSPELEKYIKYSTTTSGFAFVDKAPTSSLYKFTFHSIGDMYAMSFTPANGKRQFIGLDAAGNGIMKTETVSQLNPHGLFKLENASSPRFISVGSFGTGTGAGTVISSGGDDFKTLGECINYMELNMEDELDKYKAVAYRGDKKECRGYGKDATYSRDDGWLTTCTNKNKSVDQGCLL